jgi:glutamate-1-semialdehyde 2,1-aminomutase
MEGGYHGTTDWAEFSIAKSDPINRNPLMPVPNSRGIPLNPGKDLFIAPFNDLETVENILKAHAKEIAAILLEPILGGLGIICPLPGYLQGLRTLADKYDVLLIFDEVQTLRVSYGGAQEKYGVIPDITAVAKIIGGGLPIGAFGGREDIMAVYDQTLQGNLSHGGTFNGNRAAMAAGVVTMKLFDHAAIEKLELLGARLEKGLKNAIKENNVPMSVNRVGSLLHVHLVPESPHNWLTVAAAYPIWHLNTMMHLELINRGVFTAPRGTWALCTAMTEADIDLGIKAFAESVAAISPYFKV